MSTPETTQKFEWLPAFDPNAPTVAAMPAVDLADLPTVAAMPAVNPAESQTVIIEAVPTELPTLCLEVLETTAPKTPSPFEFERHTGQIALADQANQTVRLQLDAKIEAMGKEMRTYFAREGQLTPEDWAPAVRLIHSHDQEALTREWTTALKAAQNRMDWEYSVTGAYLSGAPGLRTVAQYSRQSDTAKYDIPATSVEDLEAFIRIVLHEGFFELSADPDNGGRKLAIAVQFMRESMRHVPDFNPENAGLQALLARTIYYRAAYPNKGGIESFTTQLVRDCYFVAREAVSFKALETLEGRAA